MLYIFFTYNIVGIYIKIYISVALDYVILKAGKSHNLLSKARDQASGIFQAKFEGRISSETQVKNPT